MTGPVVTMVASYDDAGNAHSIHRSRALQRLGCEVEDFNLDWRPGLLERLRGRTVMGRLAQVLDEVRPEVVLVVGDSVALPPDGVTELQQEFGGKWVLWITGDVNPTQTLTLAKVFHRVVATATDLAERVAQTVGAPVALLPFAADPSVYRPNRSRDNYRANLVFAGRATPYRESLLAGLAEFGLAVWGPGWRKTSLRDYCRGEVPDTAGFVRAYGGATLGINIHDQPDGASNGAVSCNQRVFELAAMGVPQLVDHRVDLERFFTPGIDLITYRTGAELKELVGELLHDTMRLEALANAARQELLARHTYMHRVSDLLRKLDCLGGARGGSG